MGLEFIRWRACFSNAQVRTDHVLRTVHVRVLPFRMFGRIKIIGFADMARANLYAAEAKAELRQAAAPFHEPAVRIGRQCYAQLLPRW